MTLIRRCGFTNCPELIPANIRYCRQHATTTARGYGHAHQRGRLDIFEKAGWRCVYCNQPVSLSDDIAHLEPTRTSPSPRKGPAHRACHNKNAPHLQ